MVSRLYELTAEYAALLRAAEDGEDVTEALAQCGECLDRKALGIAHVIRELDVDVHAIDAEIKRLSARLKAREAAAARLREYVVATLRAAGLTRIQGATRTLSVVARKLVEVDDLALIPAEFLRTSTTVEAKKLAIREAYDLRGECVPGTHIGETFSLEIR